MFNKRETSESEPASHAGSQPQAATTKSATPAAPAASPGRSSGQAIIGPTISIDGTLKGEEDLVVEGRVKGTVELRSNTLTIGSKGTLDAQVYAHTILVEGTVKGDLYASERISIQASARIDGNILAPRISLEDGAKFRGSIDMNPESEAFREAFKKTAAGTSPQRDTRGKRGEKDTGKHDVGGSSPASGTGQPQAAEQRGKTGTSAA